MTIAVIDNGSLEAAATRNLRVVAATLSAAAEVTVHPISWKHSDRIPVSPLDGETPGIVLAPFVRERLALGERHFVFVPFFISPQGAIGSALRDDLEKLQPAAASFQITFTRSLADEAVVAPIVAARIRETIALASLDRPPVIVVDHGGPSPASAALRNQVADEVRVLLDAEIGPLTAASMEGGDHAHNHPLLAEQLRTPGFDTGDVVVALLFLSPGRHAGPVGDIARLCGAAETANPTLRCHLTDLVGTHPLAPEALASALRATLISLHAPLSA